MKKSITKKGGILYKYLYVYFFFYIYLNILKYKF